MKLLLASNNPGKIHEVKHFFKGTQIEILSLDDVKIIDDSFADLANQEIEEVGQTYQDNALLKAKFFADKTQLMTMAEDSGLEVASLDNFPGVNSKRWLSGSDLDRNMALLKKLEEITNRQAKFVAIICLYNPIDQSNHFFTGEVTGNITYQPKGATGFGYDSIFIPSEYQQTFAELGLAEKNKISHRLKALQKLKEFLNVDKGLTAM